MLPPERLPGTPWLASLSRCPTSPCDFHGPLVEGRRFRAGITDEYVQLAETVPHALKHGADLLGAADVCVHQEAIGAALAHCRQGFFGSGVVLKVMDGGLRALFCKLQGDAPADPARTAGNQRILACERHSTPPRRAMLALHRYFLRTGMRNLNLR